MKRKYWTHRPKGSARLQVRRFECNVCGAVGWATKCRGFTRAGHIKDMYCWRCRRETPHRQTED